MENSNNTEITPLPIEDLIKRCHQSAVDGGWWHDINTGEKLDRNDGELRMLIISEIAEAMEGLRKDLMDDKLPHRKMEEVELADTVIRICDYIGSSEIEFSINGYKDTVNNAVAWGVDEKNACNLYNMVAFVVYGEEVKVLSLITFYSHHKGYDLLGAINEKLEYNAIRADHKPENRKKAGGKAF